MPPTYIGTADENGDWSIDITDPLALGAYSVRARQSVNGSPFGAWSDPLAMSVNPSSPVTGTPAALHLDPVAGQYFRDGAWRDLAAAFDFSRASAGASIDANLDRLIAADGVFRVDHDPATGDARGALLEGAETNAATYSRDFNSGGAIIQGAAVTSEAPWQVLTEDTGNSLHRIFRPGYSVVSGFAHTLSVEVKHVSRQWLYLAFYDGSASHYANFDVLNRLTGAKSSGAVTPHMQPTIDGGVLIGLTATPATTNSAANIQFGTSDGNFSAPRTFLGTGAQVKVNEMQFGVGSFPTSRIRTEASAATRAADVMSIGPVGGLPFEGFSATEISGVVAFRTAPGKAGNQVLWQIDDGSEGDRLRIVRDAGGNLRFIATVGGVEQCNLDLGVVADSTTGKIAFRAVAGDFAATLDGAATVTDGAGTFPTVTTSRFGHSFTGEEWFGHLALGTLFAAALDNAELQEMAS